MTDRLLKYAFVLGVTVFFAVMWGLLIRRNLSVPGTVSLQPDYDALLGPEQQKREEQWGVYFGSRRIGRSELRITREMNGFILIRSDTLITIEPAVRYVLGISGDLDIRFKASISPLRGLNDFQVVSERLDTSLLGAVSESGIRILGHIGQDDVRTVLPYSPDVFFGEVLSPLAALPELSPDDVGRLWTVDMVNPFAGGIQRVTVKVAASRQVDLADGRTRVYRLSFTTGAARWESWVNEDGGVLIQGTPFGVTIRREDLPADVVEQLATEEPAATQPAP